MNIMNVLLVLYEWAWSGFTNVNVMVCGHAPFRVKKNFPTHSVIPSVGIYKIFTVCL